ncbi:Protein of unknown function DUF2130 [uncultured Caudovirales phage]|uniref:DUF2130 domain-containing protein n=1 Tax=uncultured Caudovirales phage TaxID=2100421 RepID=A0A6J5LKU1_9CAUD|nr:Protein of unknown function DUF2130 [uncultured Caudovirales phage]CAB4135134.1 Protein of unknown function DUF2130 [uncultured Caudovirales phage]
MSDGTIIKCPKCRYQFALTDAITAPVIEAARQAHTKELEEHIKQSTTMLENARAEAFSKGKADAAGKLALANEELVNQSRLLAIQEAKLAVAQSAQAEALRKTRELDEAKRELELTIAKRINDSIVPAQELAREAGRKEADETHTLRLREKEKVLEELQGKICELERKATHGDNRIQGEVQEIELEKRLHEAFPCDNIVPVPKGVYGGDCALHVLGVNGAVCGSILYESKDTQTFDTKWLSKLRDDQRNAGADLAVLVTRAMPKDVESFSQVEGVWVVKLSLVVALTEALRLALITVHTARKTSEGRETKAEMLYAYLTSNSYKHRLSALIESVAALQTGLTKEKAAIERQWALRSTTHDRLVSALVGMHGDVAGIAGQSVQELEAASLKALGSVGS